MTEEELESIIYNEAEEYFEPYNCHEGISFVAHIVMEAIKEDRKASRKWYEFWKWGGR